MTNTQNFQLTAAQEKLLRDRIAGFALTPSQASLLRLKLLDSNTPWDNKQGLASAEWD